MINLTFIAELILGGSIIGMIIMVVLKAPELNDLEINKSKKNSFALHSKLTKSAKKSVKKSTSIANSVRGAVSKKSKNKKRKNNKDKEVKLSDDYWEKVRESDPE